jgi:hypothetical protein
MVKLMAMIKLKIREIEQTAIDRKQRFLPLDIPIGFLCLVHFEM